MSEIVGHVDARGRPVISLSIPGQDDSFLVTVDTGFNRHLLIDQAEVARLRCDSIDLTMSVELAGRERRRLKVSRGRIVWFGHVREVEVMIAPASARRPALADEPIGLLGTSLLSPHTLTIDFAARRVAITETSE